MTSTFGYIVSGYSVSDKTALTEQIIRLIFHYIKENILLNLSDKSAGKLQEIEYVTDHVNIFLCSDLLYAIINTGVSSFMEKNIASVSSLRSAASMVKNAIIKFKTRYRVQRYQFGREPDILLFMLNRRSFYLQLGNHEFS